MSMDGLRGWWAALNQNLGYLTPSGAASTALPPTFRMNVATVVALVAVTLLAASLRFYAVGHFQYTHPDEEIARAVVSSVLKNDDSDTNWARTDVSKTFHYTEYNFSSYYLFAAEVERLLGKSKVDVAYQAGTLHRNLRLLSAGLGSLCILFAGILGWRVGGRLCGLTTAVLTACSVTLFQDSLYARPETFVTLLTLLFLLALASDRIHRGLVLTVTGFLLGLLISCKITFLIYFPFPLLLAPALLSTPEDGKPAESHLFLWSGSLCAYFLAIGIGFAVGAPYAVRYPWEYVEGLVPLMKQYENGAWPNGLKDADILARFGNSAAFVAYTVGYPALLLALAGLGRILWRRDIKLLLIIAGPLLTLIYFMQTKAFFERNFSQALPVLFLLAGLGLKALVSLIRQSPGFRNGVAIALLIVAATMPALVTGKAITALDGGYQSRIDAEVAVLNDGGRVAVLYGWHLNAMDPTQNPFCGSYVLGTRVYRSTQIELGPLLSHGYTIAGSVPSLFGEYPISTLQTYLAPSMLFIAPPKSMSCTLELAPLALQSGEIPVRTPLKASDGWPDVSPLRAGKNDSWPWPRYSSLGGSDANTGTLTLGPFHVCSDFVVPYTIGTSGSDVSLQITRKRTGGDQVLYDGTPLFAPGQWQQITVHMPPGQCGDYTVSATDSGPGWQQWLGIGVPVILKGVTAGPNR